MEGGVVLSATINRYAHGSLRLRNDGRMGIESVDLGISLNLECRGELAIDGTLDLVKAAIRRLGQNGTGGYDLVLRSDAPPESGLGSSSTMVVALVGLLREHCQLALTRHEVARLAYVIEREDLGLLGGLQDHYAATFGGFNFMEFGDEVTVNALSVSDATVKELELNLLLCFTGVTRVSANVLGDQTARVRRNEETTLAGLRAQKEIAVAMKRALVCGQLDDFGMLLGEAWKHKKKFSPLITTPLLDEAYELALAHGALGGKVTGAGGGGHMIFYCDAVRTHRVAEALERFGAAVTTVRFEREGVTTWRP
jgi:D-glycero-alpha-D-manno-heptose-7-phosphate kinase